MRTASRERAGRRIRAFGLASCALFTFACASQAPPPGGPPDQIPPEILRTWPGPDSVGVPADATLLIRFSEPMDPRSVEEAFFLSPSPAGGLRFRWRGPTLEVRPSAPLAPGRTYLVSVGTGCRDEAGNPMAASRDFAFATGGRIAGGEIQGRALPLDGGRSQVYVVTYQLGSRRDPDPYADPPDYATQAAPDGSFRFPRLSPGRFRIFAYEDRDRDRTPSPGVDPLAIPPVDVELPVTDTLAVLGDLRPVLRDAGPPALTSARSPDRTHVVVGFKGPVADSIRLYIRGGRGLLGIRAVHVDPADPLRALLLTELQTRGEAYRVTVDLGTAADTIASGESRASSVFRGSEDPDRTAPRLLAALPPPHAGDVRSDRHLEMAFSEPMATGDPDPLWIASDTTDAPAGTFRWTAADRLVFTPASPWTQARRYLLVADSRRLQDAAGNPLSGVVRFAFATLDSARLGGISGRILVSGTGAGAPVRIEAIRAEDPGSRFDVALQAPGEYAFDGLPAGGYEVTAFLDRDADGRWDGGRVSPFLPSEPFQAFADSVSVRPRWVTEGIDLSLQAVSYTDRSGARNP